MVYPLKLFHSNSLDKTISKSEYVPRTASLWEIPKFLQMENIDKGSSLRWLQDKQLYPETKGILVVIQDGVVLRETLFKTLSSRQVQEMWLYIYIYI